MSTATQLLNEVHVVQKTFVDVACLESSEVQRRAWLFTVNKPFESTDDRKRLRNDGKAKALERGGETV
jgi:hypothetical protein